MFNIGFGELIFILSIALLVLGPRKLPELARGLGRFLREFRRQTEEVRSVVEREFYKMDQELEAPLPKLAPPEGTRSIPPLHEAHAIPAEALAGAEATGAQAETSGVPAGDAGGNGASEAPEAQPASPQPGSGATAGPPADAASPHRSASPSVADSNASGRAPSPQAGTTGAGSPSLPEIQKAAES